MAKKPSAPVTKTAAQSSVPGSRNLDVVEQPAVPVTDLGTTAIDVAKPRKVEAIAAAYEAGRIPDGVDLSRALYYGVSDDARADLSLFLTLAERQDIAAKRLTFALVGPPEFYPDGKFGAGWNVPIHFEGRERTIGFPQNKQREKAFADYRTFFIANPGIALPGWTLNYIPTNKGDDFVDLVPLAVLEEQESEERAMRTIEQVG
jgi:hypothetical protein